MLPRVSSRNEVAVNVGAECEPAVGIRYPHGAPATPAHDLSEDLGAFERPVIQENPAVDLRQWREKPPADASAQVIVTPSPAHQNGASGQRHNQCHYAAEAKLGLSCWCGW
jgi:hypothetical protein